MKTGLIYNVFDGEETFEASLNNMQQIVDCIVIVLQKESYTGIKATLEMIALTEKFAAKGIKVIEYETKPELRGDNHIVKYNLGLEYLRSQECTHFLLMDADEFYDITQFKACLKKFVDGNYDSSYCEITTYYGDEYSYFYEDYKVPLFYKLNYEIRQFMHHGECSYLCDPKRSMTFEGEHILFKREEIEMHHYSYIRNNYSHKFKSHPAQEVVQDRPQRIEKYLKEHIYYDKGLIFQDSGNKAVEVELKKLDNPKWRCKRWIDIVAVTYGQNYNLKCFINSIKCQTNNNWRLIIMHDGLNHALYNDLLSNGYLEYGKVEFVQTNQRQQKWGHPLRQLALEKIVTNEYVLLTNADNYYCPVMVDEVLKRNEDFVFFDCIHNHSILYSSNKKDYGLLNSQLLNSHIDMGSAVIRTDIAKRVGFNHTDFAADWHYFQEVLNQKVSTFKINKCLFVHN